VIRIYEEETGAGINLPESKALPVGSRDIKINIMSISTPTKSGSYEIKSPMKKRKS
jgi:hypothetical protein